MDKMLEQSHRENARRRERQAELQAMDALRASERVATAKLVARDLDYRSMKQLALGLFLCGCVFGALAGGLGAQRDYARDKLAVTEKALEMVASDRMSDCHFANDGTVDGIVYRRVFDGWDASGSVQ